MSKTPRGHELDEDGFHDEDECRKCLLSREVKNKCRCAECCRQLIIEVDLQDAKREPKIAERGKPLKGGRELIGYLLNGDDGACVFLDQTTNLCTIYRSRPLSCRLFDCATAGELIDLKFRRENGAALAAPSP